MSGVKDEQIQQQLFTEADLTTVKIHCVSSGEAAAQRKTKERVSSSLSIKNFTTLVNSNTVQPCYYCGHI